MCNGDNVDWCYEVVQVPPDVEDWTYVDEYRAWFKNLPEEDDVVSN